MPTRNPVKESTEEVGPFGNPDGARAQIEDLLSSFVDFSGAPAFGDLATRAGDASARVIVGKLGAGKTVYLRRLQDFQARQDSVYADHPQQSLPSTELIVRACQWFPEHLLTEKWIRMWHRAIFRSLATHLLYHRDLSAHLPGDLRESIPRDYRGLLGEARRPRSIYSQLATIINEAHSAHSLTKYLDDDRWDDLEYDLADAVRGCPPVFFYLDAIDDAFHYAPMYWLRCQLGLFYMTMRLLRDARLGGRLHIVISIRDIVLSSVYRDEHAPKYIGEPHIRVLDWSGEALEYLLRAKIRMLPSDYRMTEDRDGETVASWLGAEWIHNERRGVDENLSTYLLRHTRLIPRDLVALGNALCHEVTRQRAAGTAEFPPQVLRDVVSRCARRFGNSQLSVVANQLASDLMPRKAAIRGYGDTYIGSEEYASGLKGDVRDLLGIHGKDLFSAAELAQLESATDATLQGECHLATVLWQNGLLGYREGQLTHFYSLSRMDEFDIPRDAAEYVLHPCLIDAVPGLDSVGKHPVVPFG
ncbi:hypothetical protein SAMN05660657_00135 [Geodermatophilus amargosae]|uniref:AAA ATPase domain-containing protein n=1 Tax=Geodermatophilus amargosae TaxID=1296565 RepID=A0A1I6X5K4_9ACTN|nr:hypothetical protein [Geodermatophilus amargosae]SFT33439.1 hypothetical protein SAMN05660657_00135 [Geodermatophilus amargosae]